MIWVTDGIGFLEKNLTEVFDRDYTEGISQVLVKHNCIIFD